MLVVRSKDCTWNTKELFCFGVKEQCPIFFGVVVICFDNCNTKDFRCLKRRKTKWSKTCYFWRAAAVLQVPVQLWWVRVPAVLLVTLLGLAAPAPLCPHHPPTQTPSYLPREELEWSSERFLRPWKLLVGVGGKPRQAVRWPHLAGPGAPPLQTGVAPLASLHLIFTFF